MYLLILKILSEEIWNKIRIQVTFMLQQHNLCTFFSIQKVTFKGLFATKRYIYEKGTILEPTF